MVVMDIGLSVGIFKLDGVSCLVVNILDDVSLPIPDTLLFCI
jgi:hypothetical protein